MSDNELKGCTEIPSDAKFKFAQQKVLLTYKTHLDKDGFAAYISKLIGCEPKFLRCAHENGKADDACPYEHTHAVIDFGKRVQTTNARHFDYDGIHPHILKITTKAGWSNAVNYIAKEDPDNEDLRAVNTEFQITNMLNQPTALAAVVATVGTKNGKVDYREAIAIEQFYKSNRPTTEEHDVIELEYQWQRDLAAELAGPPHKRKVIWVYDPVGGTGKSDLSLYLSDLDRERYLSVDGIGKSGDLNYILTSAIRDGWNGGCTLIDIPRDCEDHRSVYQTIESLKNGRITSTKYEGGVKRFRRGHVVVMANFLPIANKLSLDRWDCRHITPDLQLVPITVSGDLRSPADAPARSAALRARREILLEELARLDAEIQKHDSLDLTLI